MRSDGSAAAAAGRGTAAARDARDGQRDRVVPGDHIANFPLRRGAGAADQALELRVRAKAVKSWVNFEVCQPVGTLLVSLLEPHECLILCSKARIDQGN